MLFRFQVTSPTICGRDESVVLAKRVSHSLALFFPPAYFTALQTTDGGGWSKSEGTRANILLALLSLSLCLCVSLPLPLSSSLSLARKGLQLLRSLRVGAVLRAPSDHAARRVRLFLSAI